MKKNKINMSFKATFPELLSKKYGLKNRLRNFRILNTQPVGRPKDIISSIIVALGIASAATMTTTGVTIGLGIGLTWAGITSVVVAAATIGFTVWSAFSQKSGGVGGGGGAGGGTMALTTIDQNGQLVNTRQSSKPLQVIYGKCRVGNNWVFARPSSATNNIENIVITWGEGEIEGLAPAIDFTPLFTGSGPNDIHTGGDFVYPGYTPPEKTEIVYYMPAIHYRVQIDGTGSPNTFKWSDDGGTTWDATVIPITGQAQALNNGVTVKFDSVDGHTSGDHWDFWAGDGLFIGERLLYYYKRYGGSVDLAYHSMHYGTADQLPDSALQDEIKEWNEAMRYTAYSYLQLIYNTDAWRSIPDFTAVIRGRKLYDPRDGSTIFSRNPALVWLDWLSNGRYGLGVPISMIDLQSVMDVATWCDDHEFYFDGVITDRKAFMDNFEDIMINFRAFTVYSEGIYYLRVFTDDAAAMTLDENDVEISPESFTIKQPGIPESPARVTATFADKEQNYTANVAAWPQVPVIQYEESLEREGAEKTLIGSNSMTQSKKIAKYGYLKRQFDKSFSILAHPRCFDLEPGDMIQMTHEFPGWTLHKVRVQDVSYPQQGLVPLTLTDEDSSIYDETV